jgi:hypothetical protein
MEAAAERRREEAGERSVRQRVRQRDWEGCGESGDWRATCLFGCTPER